MRSSMLFARSGLEGSCFVFYRVLFNRRNGFHGNVFAREKLSNVIDGVAADVRDHYRLTLKGDDQERWVEAET